jgi:hypothetical protein
MNLPPNLQRRLLDDLDMVEERKLLPLPRSPSVKYAGANRGKERGEGRKGERLRRGSGVVGGGGEGGGRGIVKCCGRMWSRSPMRSSSLALASKRLSWTCLGFRVFGVGGSRGLVWDLGLRLVA